MRLPLGDSLWADGKLPWPVLTVAMVLLKPTNYICCSVCMMVRSKEIATTVYKYRV